MRVLLISMSTSSRRAGECSVGSTRLAGWTGEESMAGREAEVWRRTSREAAGWGGHGLGRGAVYKTAGVEEDRGRGRAGPDLRLE